MKTKTNFMQIAMQEALKAYAKKEVPIGAVVVKDDRVISKAHNIREKKQNALKHAEIIAIDKACKKLKSWRLDGCEIYVTLEPCPMCAGAIVNARLDKVIYAAEDKTSDDKLFEKIISSNRLNHKCDFEIDKDFQKTSSDLLQKFFKERRENKKTK